MKQNFKIFGLVIVLMNLVYLSSCEKTPTCKSCSAVQEIYQNGTLTATQNISAIEYCDDQLQQIEANPVITTNQTSGSFTQSSTTTYTCQ